MSDQPPGPPGPSEPHDPNQPYRPQPGYGPPPQYGQPPYGQPEYAQPQYGQPQYGQPQYGQPQPARGPIDFGKLLGERVRLRPEPRVGPSLAAGGAALALVGVAIWSVGYFVSGFHLGFGESGTTVSGDSRRFLGAGLFLVLVVAGYVLTITRRRGPLATAGTVAIVAGVPGALLFLFLDIAGTFSGGGFPFNIDAFYLITIIVYLASYFAVPGTAGRAVFLALAASGLYSYVAFKVGSTSAVRAGASIFNGASGGPSTGGSSTGSIAAVGLIFGLVYYAVAALLDRRGRPGAAIALVYAGFGATISGIGFSANPFGQAGTGVELLLIGGALALYGGWAGRRFTTWFWTAAATAGVIVLVLKIDVGQHYAIVGIVLIVLGALLVAATPAVSAALHESPDLPEPAAPAAPQQPPAAGYGHPDAR